MKTLLQFIIGVAVSLGTAFLLKISAATDYSWFMGAVHGLLFVPNLLIKIFDPSWLTEAVVRGQYYGAAWWTCAIINVIYWIWTIVGAVMSIVGRCKSKS